MVKVQRFLTEQRQALVIGLTVLLILAEAFRFISSNNLMYQILMATAGVIGLLPILFTAISSLEVRLISIDVLVSIAVIGAFIIGEYNEAAILFLLPFAQIDYSLILFDILFVLNRLQFLFLFL